MKQLFFTLFAIMNLVLGGIYLWGADNNRYVCAWLWGIAPTLNLVLYCMFEKELIEEND